MVNQQLKKVGKKLTIYSNVLKPRFPGFQGMISQVSFRSFLKCALQMTALIKY